MQLKKFFAASAGLLVFLYVFMLPVSAQAQSCYTANITITNASATEVDSVSVNFSRGNPFAGTLVIGPVIGTVGPIPANGQASFKLTGTWGQKPDNVVISSVPDLSYSASIKSGCGGGGDSEPYVLPGLPTNSHQGFILPPENEGEAGSGNFQLWVVDADGNGSKAVELSPAEIAALPELPESNQLISSGPGFAFYVLTTGELQVNLGPTADGWYDVVVFDREFNVTNTYRTR